METPHDIVPVILSGGFGTRLWPASRRRRPKQSLHLVDDRTLFGATLERAAASPFVTPPIVVCNEDHHLAVARELAAAGLGDARLVLEPAGRNTAPAVAAAAIDRLRREGDALLMVLPADHVVRDEEALRQAALAAAGLAARGRLMTFGARPTAPETGYGYIEVGEPLDGGPARIVESFREKPDRSTAAAYLDTGRYLWNSGMFLMAASTYLEELERLEPDLVAAVRLAVERGADDGNVLRLDAGAFEEIERISIDYAVMEHTHRAAVVPLDAGWSDVGSWDALWAIGEHDAHGNVTVGDVETMDTTNSYVRAAGGRLVATIGLTDAVIVDTRDALLVTSRDRSQDVRALVERLSAARRREVETDGSEERPWGRFVTLNQGPGFRVLRMWIDPGGKTSLQTHQHRSEYWIVVRGVARVRLGETTRLIPARESVFIPVGELHRLENPEEDEVLEVIEVDVGTYVGEDDIKRFADIYGRAERNG